MYVAMSNSRRTSMCVEQRAHFEPINWRTPPQRWRQWFVGSLLTLPGAVGGLILSLALPWELAPLLALAGAFTGLQIGFKMENR